MKKIMMLLGLITVVAFVASYAQTTNEVKSVNVVGYVKITIPSNKMTMGSFNFDPINSPTQTLNGIFSNQLTAGASALAGDNIVVWDKVGLKYKTFYKHTTLGWRNKDNLAELMTNEVLNGDAFWISSHQTTNQTVTFMGQVVDIPTFTNAMPFAIGMNMFGYPFPTEMGLRATSLFSNAVKGASALAADNVIYWDTNTMSYITYFAHTTLGWRNKANLADTNFVLKPGFGYWYVRRNTTTNWNEVQPYNLSL